MIEFRTPSAAPVLPNYVVPTHVLPGETIPTEPGFMKGHGSLLHDESELTATVSGTVERINKLVSVRAVHSRYDARAQRHAKQRARSDDRVVVDLCLVACCLLLAVLLRCDVCDARVFLTRQQQLPRRERRRRCRSRRRSGAKSLEARHQFAPARIVALGIDQSDRHAAAASAHATRRARDAQVLSRERRRQRMCCLAGVGQRHAGLVVLTFAGHASPGRSALGVRRRLRSAALAQQHVQQGRLRPSSRVLLSLNENVSKQLSRGQLVKVPPALIVVRNA